ncbi:TolC family protein [Segatella copri]|uniref:TolC family protein n=1 Tax=Segatella copri TaxID=165179 RepID=UPI002939EF89|nr:TolC family protein [Segatella copri]MDV3107247.1 TolC family protein [Segatella copri]MDV3114286.1 TolC family protein [Segatella copri]
MKIKNYIFIASALAAMNVQADTLQLDLAATIAMAQRQSPSVQSARNTFLSAYWAYRYHQANYLPSLSLSSSPYINKEVNKITQSDGTALFLKQDQLGADLTLKINQNISLTGGSLFVKSSLNRLDELHNKITAYSSQPFVVGYEQSLFGYNSLKWNRRIEPIRFRESKKRYAETLEIVSAKACEHFFGLASAQAEWEMAKQNFASADTLYQMAKGRYENGTISENEMLQLEINRLNEETNVMDAQVALREKMQTIRSFLGLEQSQDICLVMPEEVPAFEVPLQRAIDWALLNSSDPDYYRRIQKESESRLAQARANAGLKADLYMQFGLSQTGADIGAAYRSPMSQQSASITIALPILDWGRGKGRVREAKSQLALTQTQVEQGMRDFYQNVEKLVLQFNMQARKVHVASLTDQRAEKRHVVARRLYIMGRNSILDLNAAISEKDAARRNYISTMRTYWSLYYTLRSMTGFDFEHNKELKEELPIESFPINKVK